MESSKYLSDHNGIPIDLVFPLEPYRSPYSDRHSISVSENDHDFTLWPRKIQHREESWQADLDTGYIPAAVTRELQSYYCIITPGVYIDLQVMDTSRVIMLLLVIFTLDSPSVVPLPVGRQRH